jgi:hypothetical protein
MRGDFDGALAGFAKARELAAGRGEELRAASMTVSLAAVSRNAADFRASLDYAVDAVERFRRVGSERGVAIALVACGWSAHAVGDTALAGKSFHEAIALAGELSSSPLVADGAAGLGVVLIGTQEEERGAQLLGAAAALRDELDATFDDDDVQRKHDAAVVAAGEALGEDAFAAAWARGEALTPAEIVAFTMPP